jgi:hypothetical protein
MDQLLFLRGLTPEADRSGWTRAGPMRGNLGADPTRDVLLATQLGNPVLRIPV